MTDPKASDSEKVPDIKMPEDADFEVYDVTCARCGKVLPCTMACAEEGDEWECLYCNKLWNRIERAESALEAAQRRVADLEKIISDWGKAGYVEINPPSISPEQLCRDLLTQAITDGLVGEPTEFDDPDPQCRSAGELVGMANLLSRSLSREPSASPPADSFLFGSDINAALKAINAALDED